MEKYSDKELHKRSLHRIALVLYGYWEEGRGAHTRLFDTLIPDDQILIGESLKGRGHREHVVPCVVIRNLANEMYSQGATIDEVVKMLMRLLRVAYITKDEAHYMDHVKKLKVNMPQGWCPHQGSVTARLDESGIVLKNVSAINKG